MAKANRFSKEQLQLVLAVVLFTGAFGYLYWKYFFSPYAKKINEANTQIEAINMDIAKATGESKKLDQIKAEVERLQQEELRANQQLPRGRKLPDLIYTLMRLSHESGVAVSNIVPVSKADKPYFSESVYSLNVAGTYHSVGKFVAELGTSRRIFSVRNMIFSPDNSPGRTVTATFQLVTYQYKE